MCKELYFLMLMDGTWVGFLLRKLYCKSCILTRVALIDSCAET